MMITLLMNLIGLAFGLVLFINRPILSGSKDEINNKRRKISVVIPARNEEENLKNILMDLKNQKNPVFEIICVDDDSEDGTSDIAKEFEVKLIHVTDRPENWFGKAWACQCGANEAIGDLLLFIDADVRLKPDAINKLVNQYEKDGCVVSVQPYHQVLKFYEQISFFFNVIMVAGNSRGFLPIGKTIGLFGPVILINKEQYRSINGHFSARESIVDDLSMGEELSSSGMKYAIFYGDEDISFRMYGTGFSGLFQGWTKNFATGACKTSLPILIMIIAWVTACGSIAINFTTSIIFGEFWNIAAYSILYFCMVLELKFISEKIGSFKRIALLFYPVLLLAFIILFVISIINKYCTRNVMWKGRKIKIRR